MLARPIHHSDVATLPSVGAHPHRLTELIIDEYDQWRDPATTAAAQWCWRSPSPSEALPADEHVSPGA